MNGGKGIYIGGTLISILISLWLYATGRRESAIFVGLWPRLSSTWARASSKRTRVSALLRPGGRFELTLEEGRPLSSAERRRIPEGEEVWLTPESEFRELLEAIGFQIRWVEDHTGSHAEVAGRLAAAFRRDRATIVAALGSQTSNELVMAHERWAEWLSDPFKTAVHER